MSQAETSLQNPSNFQIGAAIAAAVGIILGFIGAVTDIDHFFEVYLTVYIFALNLSLGCLGLLMLTYLVDSRWGFSVQRILAAGARTLPLLGILFIPLMFDLEHLYPWGGQSGDVADLAHGDLYLYPPFVILRVIIYFAIWISLAYVLTAWGYEKRDDDDPGRTLRLKRLSTFGMIVFFLTVTFYSFDLIMSVEDGWFSTVFGWLVISQQGLTAFAFAILVLGIFWNQEPLRDLVNQRVVNDLAALLLVSLMIWIYLSFMQYFVIWNGNVAKKAIWYDVRSMGAWEGFIGFLIVTHGAAFIAMAIPGLKRIREVLIMLAVGLLVMRLFELYWFIAPSYSGEIEIGVSELALPLAFGGLWVLLYQWLLVRHPLLPEDDPSLEAVLAHDDQQRGERPVQPAS